MVLDPLNAIRLSAVVAAWAVVLGTPLAIGLGWVLARKQFPGRLLLTCLVLAPLVLPPVVTGFVLLRLFGPHHPLGGFLQDLGLRIPFSLTGAVIAALVMALPLYTLAARSAFEAVDRRFEEVSWTLGYSPWATFRRITLPLAAPGLVAGAILAFARALGEFGATAVLAGNIEGQTRTIALAIYTLLDAPNRDREIGFLVWASLGLSLAALIGYELLNRRLRQRLEDAHD